MLQLNIWRSYKNIYLRRIYFVQWSISWLQEFAFELHHVCLFVCPHETTRKLLNRVPQFINIFQ
jgi:hypothetical protein